MSQLGAITLVYKRLKKQYTKWLESNSLETHHIDKVEISSLGFGKSPADSTRISKDQYSKLQTKID